MTREVSLGSETAPGHSEQLRALGEFRDLQRNDRRRVQRKEARAPEEDVTPMMILRGLATRRDFGARIPTWLLVAVPTAIGAIANLLWIGRQSLWQDEGVTAQVVTTTWPGFWNDITTAYGGGTTGYFLLLRMWPFHDDEQGLRSLSALFMIASVRSEEHTSELQSRQYLVC